MGGFGISKHLGGWEQILSHRRRADLCTARPLVLHTHGIGVRCLFGFEGCYDKFGCDILFQHSFQSQHQSHVVDL
jgi:hypothetical protein